MHNFYCRITVKVVISMLPNPSMTPFWSFMLKHFYRGITPSILQWNKVHGRMILISADSTTQTNYASEPQTNNVWFTWHDIHWYFSNKYYFSSGEISLSILKCLKIYFRPGYPIKVLKCRRPIGLYCMTRNLKVMFRKRCMVQDKAKKLLTWFLSIACTTLIIKIKKLTGNFP